MGAHLARLSLPASVPSCLEEEHSRRIDLLMCTRRTPSGSPFSPTQHPATCRVRGAKCEVPRGRCGHHSVRATNSGEETASCELAECVGDKGTRRKPLRVLCGDQLLHLATQRLVSRPRWKAVAFAEERAVAGCWFVAVLL